jgi:hypothetical protein
MAGNKTHRTTGCAFSVILLHTAFGLFWHEDRSIIAEQGGDGGALSPTTIL